MHASTVNTFSGAVWTALKTWRKLRFGPLSVLFKFERSVFVTRNATRRASLGRRDQDRQPANDVATFSKPSSDNKGIAVIVGVGPGFGEALAEHLGHAGFEVICVCRNAGRLKNLVEQIKSRGGRASAYGCNATMETSVVSLFELIKKNHGTPQLVVYSIQSFGPGNVVDIELPAFEDGLNHNCVGSFLVARTAARAMLAQASGSIILVGSTSSTIGRAGHLNLAVGKFGQRALAQVLARELWPRGIHVAHAVIDADIADDETKDDGEPHSNPAHIAQSILQLHEQPRSAWTSEIDLRPWNEQFWAHC